MIARLSEMIARPGSAAALSDAIENHAVPFAQKCRGFQGHLVMVLREEPRIVTVASFWNDENDIAEFERTTFRDVRALMMPFIEGDIRVRIFEVTSHAQTLRGVLQ
jgi:heme-degrading monooxygenase HmoA